MGSVDLDCVGCWRDWSVSPDAIPDRFEITVVHRSDGRYKAAVCPQCGALLSPALREVGLGEL